MNNGFSIIVCTYNGRKRLEKTFEYIDALLLPCPLEVILIDNNSTDGSKEFIDSWCSKNLRQEISYRSKHEIKPGKNNALSLGYSLSKMNYVVICDDDNWLQRDYLQNALSIMESNPKIGALGGMSGATFETCEPQWWEKYKYKFAVGRQCPDNGDITNLKGCLWGAGMILRKEAIEKLNQSKFTYLTECRTGKKLSSGGDTELCYALRMLGYKVWFDEKLFFTHFISKEKTRKQYLERLLAGISRSSFLISPYLMELNKQEFYWFKYYKKLIRLIFIKKLIYNTLALLKGTFDEQEIAKEYFRQIYYYSFGYWRLKRNINRIRAWRNSI